MTSPCSGALAGWWLPLSPAWLQIKGWQRTRLPILGYSRRRSCQAGCGFAAAQPGEGLGLTQPDPAEPSLPLCAIIILLLTSSAGWEPLLLFLAPCPVPHPSCALLALAAVISFPRPCLLTSSAPPHRGLCLPPPCWDLSTRPIPWMVSQRPPFIYFFFLKFFKPKLLKALCP